MTEYTDEPAGQDIALVGMAGRFPGAGDVDGLWETVRDGRSGVTRFTDAELLAAGVSPQLLADPAYVRAGAVIDGVDRFDAGFFGVNPKEAQILDPQHRLFLEHSWHALEDAGCDPARFDGAIGVFGGCAWSTYLTHNLEPAGAARDVGVMAVSLANEKDTLATRVAHLLGLSGPAFSVQSACSTSLVAVCVAASSLANFECDMALAGGVSIAVPQRVGYLYQQGGIAPPDGECRAFDAAGLGAPLGSGVGVVALRRLEDALADGDRVYAVLRGWAVNNDAGRKVGFTAPGVEGQAAVIAEALAAAGVGPADIDYVEAHGTGTALGDAAELAALQRVFRGQALRIGSVKTNIGHLDRAAGVTGLIKTALALHHGEIPPTRNLTRPNPQLAEGEAELTVVTERRPWPREERARLAGVSAFGIGGTNAHVVVQEAPQVPRPAAARGAELLIWSARSAAALEEATVRLAGHLETTGDALGDIAHTLRTGRAAFPHRRMLVADSARGAAATIRAGGAAGQRVTGGADRPVGFLIAGTDEGYPAATARLYRDEPVFRTAFDRCRDLLREVTGADPLAGWVESGGGAEGAAGGPADPAVFAVGYALAALVRSWGVEPSVLAGYGAGEYVAACVSGVLSLRDALALAAHRARLVGTLPSGATALVALSAEEVRARAGRAGVGVAAVHGPRLTLLCGEAAALTAFGEALTADGVSFGPVTAGPYPCGEFLEPLRAGLADWVADNVTLHPPRIPCVSTVTGRVLSDEQATDPGYWAGQLCAPVLFDTALATVLADPETVLLELGAGGALGAMARDHRDCPPERRSAVVAALPAAGDPRPADETLAEAAGRLWLAGAAPQWTGYRADRPLRRVGLPLYPFQRERYWIDPPAAEPQPEPRPAAAPAAAERVRLLEQTWSPAGEAGGATVAADGRYLIVADAGGVGEALAGLLRRAGGEVSLAASAADLAGLAGAGGGTVVHLAALDRGGPDDDGAPVVAATARVLAAAAGDGTAAVRVLVATRGGQTVTGAEQVSAAQAAVAVLPVVADQEYLNLESRCVDLDPGYDPAEAAEVLAAELGRPCDAVLVAHRAGLRHLPRYAPVRPAATASAVRAGGSYLVTGGLGPVGLTVAEHLARRGAGRLVLAGRTGLPDDPADPRAVAVARLRALGAGVETPRVDVTDPDAVRELFAGGRIDGVVHAAADAQPAGFVPLCDVDEAGTARQFGAKVDGARVLAGVVDALDAGRAPQWCVLFSSTSALLGGVTFGGYAAANAALIARAHGRGAATTRWIAAAWDTWPGTRERLDGRFGASMAAHAMSGPEALDAFDRVLAAAGPAVVVAVDGLDGRLPAPREQAPAPAAAAVRRFPRPDLPQPYTPALTATETALTEVWSSVLGVEPVGTRDNFFDLSGNSLLALQMLALVKERFGVAVPTVALFELPTVRALAALLDRPAATATAASTEPAPTASAGTAVSAGTAEAAGTANTPVAAPAAAPVAAPATAPVAASVPVLPVPVATTRPRPDADAADLDRHVAVVGMAGRFPGAGDVGRFWRNLCDGVESISFFTPEEMIAAGVDPITAHDPAYVAARPVLDDVAGFDAAFFGLSPRMAALTDPQQRLFLEVCWEALEQSGYCRPEHRGRVGVFGGSNLSTYLLGMMDRFAGDQDVSMYELVMGNDKDALTTTVSYLFDLRGPSVAVQTFCSTSLVAVHTAVRSLRDGDCEMALAGGVSVRVPDRIGHLHTPGGMESPDGHVRAFDAAARGSMFGDGATAVVLKRLGDALRDGDHIWSVIRGSAMNNDGALKVGYTAPSVVGQAAVIADAMADARVGAEDIGYVEAHGTGTELGDPIEVAALTRAFGPTERTGYCPIGSVKTNVGHLDRAAGTAGLIKASLVVREGLIPPTLHFTTPNPAIDFAHSPFHVNAALTAWPGAPERPRVAGLNSLGMGGTNVHVVVQEPPVRPEPPATDPRTARRYQVLAVSARGAQAADEAVRLLGEHLRERPGLRLADVAYTLQVGRRTFEHRRAAVADGVAGAVASLTGADGAQPPGGRVETMEGRPVAFLFTGVGEQYPGMVGELYRREPVFRAELDRCLARLVEVLAPGLPDADAGRLADLLTGQRGGGPGLAALLGRAEAADERADALQRTEIVQPLVFAVDHALAATLGHWGIRPAAMLGYSLGEYVAACLAGVLSLDDAIALVAHRARLIGATEPGAMAAVPLAAERLEERFGLERRGLDVAAVNGPEMVVVAGGTQALAALSADLREAGVACRPLRTTHAFHSRMLEPLAGELTDWISRNVTLNAPALPYLSNVTGGPADADLVCDPAYWARHMCRPVQFERAARALLADEHLAVVEIGPGQSLGALLRAAGCPPDRWPLITATLPAAEDPRPADAVLTECLARLWLLGADIDWTAHHGRHQADSPQYAGAAPGRIPLPTYPFQRQRYWIERTPAAAVAPAAAQDATGAPVGALEQFDRIPLLPEEQWIHLPVWRQTAAVRADERRPASWLVYAHGAAAEEITAGLRTAAAATDATVTVVRPGTAFRSAADGRTIRPGNVDDTVALLRGLRAEGTRLERVVHLWTLDEEPQESATTLDRGLHTLVALARGAGELGLEDWSVDIVTAGSQRVLADGEARPDAATLIGPALVVPMEYASVGARLIDVDPVPVAAEVVAELLRPAADRKVALRAGRRWVCGYDVVPPAATGTVLREGGVYLITGGLGGIGLAMAENLARDCRARLVLFGRHGLPPRERWEGIAAGTEEADEKVRTRVARVLEIIGLGAAVEVVTGDVARPADVRRAVELAHDRFGALHGVLHTAGVPGTGLMQFKQPGDADQVLAPKVAGTLAIDEALRTGEPDEVALDFLVLFSSITSVTGGGPGQVDYCAANAYLDAYAARQSAAGRRVVSVAWGEWTWNAWDDGLSGYEEGIRTFFREHRARFGIDFGPGWRTLLRAVACGESHVVVSTQDLEAVVEVAGRFTVDAVTSTASPAAAGSDGGDRHPRPELVTPYQEPDGETERTIAEAWCRSLRLERVGAIDNFFELGGTSLLSINLLAVLRRSFPEAELPPHIVHEAPTVATLAKVVDGTAARQEHDSGEQGELRRSGLRAAAARRRRS
ncbi:type I polyketide synthase [Streptantibioticus silvisoli]|uniref:Beta-ketoacyl synthase N-terminal-like domain-containing protein n=1 Tax=Streptantibioticus silvisoli TaxID=2705255 RepID=A0ABT6W8P7_9ACTN|nr:type I polyketide synthase [Streptantibioticus silvisoli]MDI5967115.1 beta-ketoacyl synthase N-terminal-like domain-containing protein [Streptantibioticus silvisoli]